MLTHAIRCMQHELRVRNIVRSIGMALVATSIAQVAPRGSQSRDTLPSAPDTSSAVLLEVSFAGGQNVDHDDGSGPYAAPHWRASASSQSPYFMQAGRTLIVADVKLQVLGPIPGALSIRGIGESGFDFPATAASPVADAAATFEIRNVKAGRPFASNKTVFYSAFAVDWQVSRDAGGTWHSAGTSRNPIYVCLGDGEGVELFRTALSLACRN